MAEAHIPSVKAYLRAGGGEIFPVDLFFGGVAERSLNLVYGFAATFDAWNLVCAAPLVRLQIDNLIRVSYVARHREPHRMAMELFDKDFRDVKDDKGKWLGDARLVKLANRHHDWIKPVYDAANGWVHLSPRQLLSTWDMSADEGECVRTLRGSIRQVVDDYPEKFLGEVLGAILEATSEIIAYMGIWEYKKEHPNHVTEK
jgi:hypothetical protein